MVRMTAKALRRPQKTATNPDFRSRCWLVKNGVSFTVVFDVMALDSHERDAMSIVFSELDGARFKWQNWQREEQK